VDTPSIKNFAFFFSPGLTRVSPIFNRSKTVDDLRGVGVVHRSIWGCLLLRHNAAFSDVINDVTEIYK